MASIRVREVRGARRYDVHYRDPDSRKRAKTFRTRREAVLFANNVEADKSRGRYIDPDAGKVSFQAYATEWLAMQTFNLSTREQVEIRLRLHAFPTLGTKLLRDVKPSTIQSWLRGLQMAATTKKVVFGNVSTIFSAAVEDELIIKNPCKAASVTKPTVQRRKVVPWTRDQVDAVRGSLPERYRILVTVAAGLGLRQGEVFGLAVEDVDWIRGGPVQIQRQVKVFGGNRQVFAPPKFERTREVPLPKSVHNELSAHLQKFPARAVALPWTEPDADEVRTARLLVSTREATALNKNYFNTIWKKALREAGVAPTRENGMHALRHWYASVLLHAGEDINAIAEHLGHSDPAFTLRTYTHLMPSSEDRTKTAIDSEFAPRDAEPLPNEEASET